MAGHLTDARTGVLACDKEVSMALYVGLCAKQVSVRTYYLSIVDTTVRLRFLELMVRWDGRRDVLNAFYDKDVLDARYQQAVM